jgi:hypothetical protein
MRSVLNPRESALARASVAAIGMSVALMVLVGLAGPSAAVPGVRPPRAGRRTSATWPRRRRRFRC